MRLQLRGAGDIGTLVVILCVGSGFSIPAAAQPHVPGEILVKFHPGVSRAAADQFHAARGMQMLETIPSSGVQRVAIPAGSTVAKMVEQYGADPDCEYAEPNYIGQGGFVPNDTSFSLQWHHNNTGQTGGSLDADMNSVEGWDISRGNAEIRIAVLDTGIDSDHPEFAGRILPGYDAVNEDNDPEADHSHGPRVTGIAAANANNNFAVAGVDHFASIVPVKVLNSSNLGTSFDLAQGLDFADDEAEVISMSLIDYPTGSSTINNALQAARDAGAILIACAGNGGIGDADVSGPGASPLTISVGATNDDDERASFSGTGSALDIVAPGSAVRTIAYNTSADTTTTFSGCSAATPVVGGMATLLLSVDPTLTHDEVALILTTTADDQVGPPGEDTPGRDDFFGHGRVNLNAALAAVSVVRVPADSDGDGFPEQGNFGDQQVITTAAVFAFSVYAADLDGDGDIDVLSASAGDNKIAWYENTDGMGTFGAQQVITTSANGAFSVFAADFDGDGDIDVLSASLNDNKIAWYENTDGLGTFGLQQVITTSANNAISVYAADLDGDGDIDVLSASANDDKVAWYENTDGLGSFGDPQVITNSADFAYQVYAADLDGDGDIDVLSASYFDNMIAWYENTDGLGSFGLQQVITTAADLATSVFAADLDGDGDTDVLSASAGDEKIAWYENGGYDNCSDVPNSGQDDTDGDGCGNVCDADYDQTGLTGFADFFEFTQAFGTFDLDLDHTEPVTGPVGFGDFSAFINFFGSAPGPSGTTSGTTACP